MGVPFIITFIIIIVIIYDEEKKFSSKASLLPSLEPRLRARRVRSYLASFEKKSSRKKK